jgi:hypothetical protein
VYIDWNKKFNIEIQKESHMTGQRLGLAGFSVVLATLAGLRTAEAGTIFNNTNNSANPVCCGYAVGLYPGSTTVFVDAYPFTVLGASYRLDTVGLLESIDGAIGPAPGGLSLFVYADSVGVPGAVLESWQGIPVDSTITLDTASSALHPFLQQGQQYWFGVTTTNPQETAIWWINPALVQGTGCASANGGPFTCLTNAVGAFEILGTPTPEPSMIVLLSTGLAVLFVRRKVSKVL